MTWSPSSWRNSPIKHHPVYKDKAALEAVEKELKSRPPLVFAGESRALKNELAKICQRDGFLLQGGDCAESFTQFSATGIRDLFKIILQMGAILTFAGGCSITKVGRVAGQFAKPRSSETETKNGVTLESYKGDIINGIEFEESARVPDPTRMSRAYNQSAATLNLLRAFAQGGFADLNEVHKWNLGFVRDNAFGKRFEELAERISQALKFMKACGITDNPKLKETAFYTSHEALLLHYEEQLTRKDSLTGDFYDCSAHMIWVGERTRFSGSAHLEFMRGVKNPLGVKIGPSATKEEVMEILDVLNPQNEAGRINLIVRMGAEKIKQNFPKLLEGVLKEGRAIVWSCDPMHGNTTSTSTGYKTRHFDAVLSEVRSFFEIHKSLNSYAGGVHLEMTGENVTECVGGGVGLTESHLASCYNTQCDPRLNAAQALEMAFLIADMLKEQAE